MGSLKTLWSQVNTRLVRYTLAFALLTATILTFIPNHTEKTHPGPWYITVDGRDTGVVAVAALHPRLNGPIVEWVARAATKADITVGFPPTDQERSRKDAWRGAIKTMRNHDRKLFIPKNGPISQPDLDTPDAWFGRSTGLAYTLAFLDSAPINTTPGSMIQGRVIAATGFVRASGTLFSVDYLPAKYAAAQEANAEILFVPKRTYQRFLPQIKTIVDPQGPKIIPVASVLEAIRILCSTGGSGTPCEVTTGKPPSDEKRGLTRQGMDAGGPDSGAWWQELVEKIQSLKNSPHTR